MFKQSLKATEFESITNGTITVAFLRNIPWSVCKFYRRGRCSGECT